MHKVSYLLKFPLLIAFLLFAQMPATTAQAAGPLFVGMGDSLGEGVQSGDAAFQTQIFSYLFWINRQMRADLVLPLIRTNPLGVVGSTKGRSRRSPKDFPTNFAVSGATLNSLLRKRANAATTSDIDNESDLVLFPRLQSQIEAAESSPPAFIVCWIGNNDILKTTTAYGKMDVSQLTPVSEFEKDYKELVDRLGKLAHDHGTKIVFGNLPDATDIGFLVDRAEAEKFLGFPVNLPDGSYTSLLGMILMQIAENDKLVKDPAFVLDASEIAQIQNQILTFNSIIKTQASRIKMPVVDIFTLYKGITENPPVIAGIPLTKSFLGGLFSLDGIHPSNIGHALLANEFIRIMNQAFHLKIPSLNQDSLAILTLMDPAIDKDKDGQAHGRPGVGLIETLAFLYGITGDDDELKAE